MKGATMIALARSALLAGLAMLFGAVALPASAGVATAGAVLLDPYDPVPEIQFHHFGGYGCNEGCEYSGGYDGCADGCGRGCHDGCRRHYYRRYRHADCDDTCYRRRHDDCDRDCRRDRCDHDCGDRDEHDGRYDRDDRDAAVPCTSEHCYDAEHYERRWRDGDHVGQEWLDKGRRERALPGDEHAGHWYGHDDADWREDDNDPPPPHDDDGDRHHHHEH
jgi:hypothetical protein